MPNKKWKKLLCILFILFVLYNVVWSAYVTFRYTPFCEKLGIGTTRLEKDRYVYSVTKPSYLSFTGNLSITEYIKISMDMPEQTSAEILIWPCGIDEYEVGIGIVKTTVDFDNHSSNSYSNHMMLDENMNLLDDTPKNRELYEQNLDKIENLYRLAYEMWGILEQN